VPHRVVFAPEAQAQLLELYRYIADTASPATALRFTGAIVSHCEELADFPLRGPVREDLRPGLRTLAFRGRVTIAYAVSTSDVTILGIFYGGADFEAMLRED
jgi:toxin ParE1/3/4